MLGRSPPLSKIRSGEEGYLVQVRVRVRVQVRCRMSNVECSGQDRTYERADGERRPQWGQGVGNSCMEMV